jgi:cytochrome P450
VQPSPERRLITIFRTLAVAATHRDVATGLRDQGDACARACVHETLRLWPTTLVILRDATRPIRWADVDLPAGTTIAIVSAWLHRDLHRSPGTPGC